jgi:predicted dehydrogenase
MPPRGLAGHLPHYVYITPPNSTFVTTQHHTNFSFQFNPNLLQFQGKLSKNNESTSMAPIRVGFLGLSKTGWAPGAHLPYLKASPDYEIVAICNSSVASSEEAIKLYSLPATTKAYGNPQGFWTTTEVFEEHVTDTEAELANDPDIDLVVCSVRVDRHFSTISPSLKAGKDVYVEWPLGKSLAEAKELLRLKNEGKVKKAVVGLQARQAPLIKKLKELIAEGRIGEVYSSTWVGQGSVGGEVTSQAYEYLTRREVGGNMVTIHFGHAIDFVQNGMFSPVIKNRIEMLTRGMKCWDTASKVSRRACLQTAGNSRNC